MSTEHRWEWLLADRVAVAATLDAATRVESVFVQGRLVSQAARGTKPEGHALADPPGVVVWFDPGVLVCILRRDGVEVPPQIWPVKKRAARPTPSVFALPPMHVVLVAVVAILAIAALVVFRDRAEAIAPDVGNTASFRAPNGRFVAHFPPTFTSRRALLPSGISGVVLEDPVRAETIVVLALASGDVPRDAWVLQQKLHAEAFANLPRAAGADEEIGREDDTCVRQRGAVVRHRVRSTRGDAALVWSCTFFDEGAGYLVMYALPESANPSEAKRLRAIVEATELTRLGEIPGQP